MLGQFKVQSMPCAETQTFIVPVKYGTAKQQTPCLPGLQLGSLPVSQSSNGFETGFRKSSPDRSRVPSHLKLVETSHQVSLCRNSAVNNTYQIFNNTFHELSTDGIAAFCQRVLCRGFPFFDFRSSVVLCLPQLLLLRRELSFIGPGCRVQPEHAVQWHVI